MWKSNVDGRVLHFRLAGINNQNFIMQDEETGTWWQQVSGEAILGPLKGKRLEPVPWDEVTFEVWKREYPQGVVLKEDQKHRKQYVSEDWETKILKRPTVTPRNPRDVLKPRDLVVGIEWSGIAKAYPMDVIARQNPVMDTVGNLSILLVLDNDGKSLRCFDRQVNGQPYDFYLKPQMSVMTLLDSQSGSEWDFTGESIHGPMKGKKLKRIQVLKDFWFDWKLYHPLTSIYP